MNGKRKSRPLVAQETGQAETAAGQAAISTPNFSTSGADSQPGGRIWQLLPEGEALAIPASPRGANKGPHSWAKTRTDTV